MTKFNELNITANKSRRRVGRGISAGQGKTAGRGTKGQNSRTGKTAKPGFAGGQNPLMQAIPKRRGFTAFWTKPTTITTDQIAVFKGTVSNDVLYTARLTKSPYETVRLMAGKNELKQALKVELQGASTGAIAMLEKAGGSFTKTPKLLRPSKKQTKNG